MRFGTSRGGWGEAAVEVEVIQVSDELEPVRQALEAIGGHLQDMQSGQGQTVRELDRTVRVVGELHGNVGELQRNVGELHRNVGELHSNVGELQGSVKNLQARAVSQEATMIALTGTFASVEQMLTRLFADRVETQELLRSIPKLRQENQDLIGIVSDLMRRVEALERRAS